MKEIGTNTVSNLLTEINQNQELLKVYAEVQENEVGLKRVVSPKTLRKEILANFLNLHKEVYSVTNGKELSPEIKGDKEDTVTPNLDPKKLYDDFNLFLKNNDKTKVENDYSEIIKKHLANDDTATNFLTQIASFGNQDKYRNVDSESKGELTKPISNILEEMVALKALEDIEKYFGNIVYLANKYTKLDNQKSLESLINDAKMMASEDTKDYVSFLDYMNDKLSNKIAKHEYKLLTKPTLRIYNAYGNLDDMSSIANTINKEFEYLDMSGFMMVTGQANSISNISDKVVRERLTDEFKALIDEACNQKTLEEFHNFNMSDTFQNVIMSVHFYDDFGSGRFILDSKSTYPKLQEKSSEDLEKLNTEFNEAKTWEEKMNILKSFDYSDFPFSLIDKNQKGE